jgi:hypothetical protein
MGAAAEGLELTRGKRASSSAPQIIRGFRSPLGGLDSATSDTEAIAQFEQAHTIATDRKRNLRRMISSRAWQCSHLSKSGMCNFPRSSPAASVNARPHQRFLFSGKKWQSARGDSGHPRRTAP